MADVTKVAYPNICLSTGSVLQGQCELLWNLPLYIVNGFSLANFPWFGSEQSLVYRRVFSYSWLIRTNILKC